MSEAEQEPEVWRDHPDYGALVQASSLGRVRQFSVDAGTWVELSLFAHDGVPHVRLRSPIARPFLASILIGECWHGRLSGGRTYAHRDGDRGNLRPCNLIRADRRTARRIKAAAEGGFIPTHEDVSAAMRRARRGWSSKASPPTMPPPSDGGEEWRPHPDYGVMLMASSHGRVMEFDAAQREWRLAKPRRHKKGYWMVNLRLGRSGVKVHQLVAEAWYGRRPVDMDTAHKDGDKDNNRPTNLMFCSRKWNSLHKQAHGTQGLCPVIRALDGKSRRHGRSGYPREFWDTEAGKAEWRRRWEAAGGAETFAESSRRYWRSDEGAVERARLGQRVSAWHQSDAGREFHERVLPIIAKLDADAVREIRRALASGERSKDLAKRYGVSATQIAKIRKGEQWRGVHDGTVIPCKRGGQKIDEQSVVDLRNAAAAGVPTRDLASRYSISVKQVYKIVTGKKWADVGGPIREVMPRGEQRRLAAAARWATRSA